MTDRSNAGKKHRRKIAKVFRRRINELRRKANRRYPGWGSGIIGLVARNAGVHEQVLRSIVFGTRDPDALTIGKIAHGLGLKVERQFEIAVEAALNDGSRAAS
jgi:hypothetical protein